MIKNKSNQYLFKKNKYKTKIKKGISQGIFFYDDIWIVFIAVKLLCS